MMGSNSGGSLPPDEYANRYLDGYGFESVCATARQYRNATFLREWRPATILEVGCGPMLLCDVVGIRDLDFACWTTVEPASSFMQSMVGATAGDRRFHVVHGLLEDSIDALRGLVPEGYEALIVSGLLHEVVDPLAILETAGALLKPGGRLLASVPNAQSFHRLLAVECGFIESPYQLSDIDLKLGHPVVLDRVSLMALMDKAGFSDLTFDGYLFKPFSNAQMAGIVAHFGDDLIPGLIKLGRKFPDHAAEICISGARRQGIDGTRRP